jgi:outer membrane protein TolC
MNWRSLVIYTVLVWATSPAHAGYDDLKKAFDSYRPPAYFQDQFRPASEVAAPAADREFTEAKRRIEEIKSRWEKSLSISTDGAFFLRPDPKLLESLRPSATDVSAAADILKGKYTLTTLETLALLRNPGIKAAQNRLRGAVEAFSQVAELDEILRTYTTFTEDLTVGVGPMKGKDPIRVKFPFPGILSLKGHVVNQEVKAQREGLESARRDAVTGVRKAYWRLVYFIKAGNITKEMVELLKYLEAVANTRYEAGKTSYQDVIKVRISRETLEENLITVREQQRNAESKIKEILNLPPAVKIGTPTLAPPPKKVLSVPSLYKVAHERRQELRGLRATVGKMERMIEMAETMIMPSYSLNLSLYEDEAVNMVGSFARKDPFPVTIKASRGAGLPKMPWYGTEDAYLRETRQKLSALRNELEKAEAGTNTMVRNAWYELDRARRETSLYQEEIVKLSQSARDVSTRGYESGKVTFADVIDSYRTWLEAKLMLERNRSNIGISWAELEQVVGTSLK